MSMQKLAETRVREEISRYERAEQRKKVCDYGSREYISADQESWAAFGGLMCLRSLLYFSKTKKAVACCREIDALFKSDSAA